MELAGSLIVPYADCMLVVTLLSIFAQWAVEQTPVDAHEGTLDDESCRASSDCAESGLCYPAQGVCIATSDNDCAASQTCLQRGACSARKGICAATSESNCESSEECKSAGRCSLAAWGECLVENARQCEESTGCRDRGLCGYAGKGSCQPRNDSDCEQSKNCSSRGECFTDGGSCRAVPTVSECAALCAADGRCVGGKGPSGNRRSERFILTAWAAA